MKIAIATDHNGELVKKEIIKFLEAKNYNIMDLSPSNNPVDDYTDYAYLVGKAVVNKEVDLGVLLCGTGIGMSIAANKVRGIRCAHISNINEASLCKEKNDANIIALSAKININELIKIIDIFINTKFSNVERHIRRINKITKIEDGEYNV